VSVGAGKRIAFDDLPTAALSGRYPGFLIDWGADQWRVWPPTGRLDSNSLKFANSGMTSANFSFVSPKRLASVRAYNQATIAGVLTINCPGQGPRQYTLSADQLVTLDLGWSGTCSGITVTSSVGWLMKLDDLMVYDA